MQQFIVHLFFNNLQFAPTTTLPTETLNLNTTVLPKYFQGIKLRLAFITQTTDPWIYVYNSFLNEVV